MMEWQCEFLSVLAEAAQVEFERRTVEYRRYVSHDDLQCGRAAFSNCLLYPDP